MDARRRVLLVAPDFRCATGMTPALVARYGRRFAYRLFPARDIRFRRRTFRRELAAADLVHWHANLAHFPEAVAALGHLPRRRVLGVGPGPGGRRHPQPARELAREGLAPVTRRYRDARVTAHRLVHGPDATPYPHTTPTTPTTPTP